MLLPIQSFTGIIIFITFSPIGFFGHIPHQAAGEDVGFCKSIEVFIINRIGIIALFVIKSG